MSYMEYLIIFDYYMLVFIGIGLIAGAITKVLYKLAEREHKRRQESQSLSHCVTAPFTQGSLGNHRPFTQGSLGYSHGRQCRQSHRPEWLEMVKNEYAVDEPQRKSQRIKVGI